MRGNAGRNVCRTIEYQTNVNGTMQRTGKPTQLLFVADGAVEEALAIIRLCTGGKNGGTESTTCGFPVSKSACHGSLLKANARRLFRRGGFGYFADDFAGAGLVGGGDIDMGLACGVFE